MNQRKGISGTLIAVLLFGVCLTAWGAPQREARTITVPIVRGWATTDAVIPLVTQRLAEEGITVVTVAAENPELREMQLLEARNGSAAYDLFIAWEALMPEMRDYVEPLDPHLRAAGHDASTVKQRFYPAVQEQVSYDGMLYWVPIHVNTQIGYARADLFTDPGQRAAFMARFGYELPQPDAHGSIRFRDAEQFLEVAQFFTRDTDGDGTIDLWGYAQPARWDHGNTVFEEILLRQGLEYFDPAGHSMWGPAHPENRAIVETIATWEQNSVQRWKVTSPEAPMMEMSDVNRHFIEGKAAMSFTWNLDFWDSNAKGPFAQKYGKPLSWSIDFLNASSETRGIMSVWGYALNRNSKNKGAAVSFLAQLADTELRIRAHQSASLPCPNGMIEVTEWAVQEGYAPAALIDAVQTTGSFWPISKRAWPETEQVRDVCRSAREELLSGRITPAEFAATTGEQIEEIMRGANYF